MTDDTGLRCEDCDAPIRPFKARKWNKCVHCSRSAIGRSPAASAKSGAATRARLADPATRAEHIARTADGLRRRLATDPVERERRSAYGRALGLSGKGLAAQGSGSPARQIVAFKQSERAIGWCPLEYRDEYRRLTGKMGVRAADARRMIEAQIAKDLATYQRTGVMQRSAGGAT